MSEKQFWASPTSDGSINYKCTSQTHRRAYINRIKFWEMGVGHPSRRISLFQKAAPMVTVGDQKSKPGVADRTTVVGVYTRPGTRQWKRDLQISCITTGLEQWHRHLLQLKLSVRHQLWKWKGWSLLMASYPIQEGHQSPEYSTWGFHNLAQSMCWDAVPNDRAGFMYQVQSECRRFEEFRG